MSELDDLRRAVQAAQRRAGNKVSRLRREKNVEVGGTRFDVRRDPSKVKRYTKNQLNNYLNELQAFTSRSTNFVAGQQKQPIPTQLWRQYKSYQERFNRAGERNFSSMANVFIGNPQDPEAWSPGMTVAERRSSVQPKKRMSGEMSNRPYSPADLHPHQVNGVEGLQAEIKRMKKRADRGYHPEALRAGRKNLNKILSLIGDKDLKKQVANLSDYQFDILWNGSNFANEIVPPYVEAKIRAMGAKDDIMNSIDESAHLDAARDMVKWAGSNPKKAPRKPIQGGRKTR